MTSRGERNNNPCNLDANGINWLGLDTPPTDGRFCRFTAPEYGIRAGCKVLLSYYDKYHLNTVRSIINRFAPPVENDTGAYIWAVCRKIGVKPDDVINVRDPETLEWLVAAIIGHECGNLPYTSDIIRKGMALAGITYQEVRNG